MNAIRRKYTYGYAYTLLLGARQLHLVEVFIQNDGTLIFAPNDKSMGDNLDVVSTLDESEFPNGLLSFIYACQRVAAYKLLE